MNNLIQKLNNVKSAPDKIETWDDIWCATLFWSQIDPIYAGNLLLSNIAEIETLCSQESLTTFLQYLETRDLKPMLTATTQYPSWIIDAVNLHSKMCHLPESH